MARRVCVVITARPSYSRIFTALEALRDRPGVELQVVVAAAALLDRYGSIVEDLESRGFPIAARVHTVLEGGTLSAMAKTTGLGLLQLAGVFEQLAPDLVVTIADRFETIGTAIAAAYLNIPVVHVQGGEVTGSIDEKVRHAVTKLADAHFVATARAAERVIRMGEDPAVVHVTGCPSIDLAARAAADGRESFDPYERYGGVGEAPDLSRGYLVVLQHPVTTEHEQARRHVIETLNAVRCAGPPALWFWPNVDAGTDGTSGGIRAFRERERPGNLHFFKHMAPTDFLRLVLGARCLVGNSSMGIRECSFLGVPVVNVGSRQAGRDRAGNVTDAGYDRHAISAAIGRQLRHGRYPSDPLYGDGHAGERMATLLADLPLSIEKRLAY